MSTSPEPETVFYAIRAYNLAEGMSTDDGQDITNVTLDREHNLVLYDTYTPRPDNPAQDEENRCAGDDRVAVWNEWVSLAVFPDTAVDGRQLERTCRYCKRQIIPTEYGTWQDADNPGYEVCDLNDDYGPSHWPEGTP